MRLDRALVSDLGAALRSRPLQLYFVVQLLAGGTFVIRRGADTASLVILIWLGLSLLAFVAWWSGRHRAAHPQPDPVPAAGARAAFALVAAAGMALWPMSPSAGFVVLLSGLVGWAWAAARAGGFAGLGRRLTRDPRPFIGLYLLIGLPQLLIGGPVYLVGIGLALPSGVLQQAALLVGLFAPLETWSRRPAAAAVVAAIVFGVLHVPTVLEPNHGDLLAGLANSVLFQANVGLIAILAYRRHRAFVPLGVVHAMAIA
jgi:Type II CAAX prenyl endopeptidase Rce1-like